jgi:hypothetical protein
LGKELEIRLQNLASLQSYAVWGSFMEFFYFLLVNLAKVELSQLNSLLLHLMFLFIIFFQMYDSNVPISQTVNFTIHQRMTVDFMHRKSDSFSFVRLNELNRHWHTHYALGAFILLSPCARVLTGTAAVVKQFELN